MPLLTYLKDGLLAACNDLVTLPMSLFSVFQRSAVDNPKSEWYMDRRLWQQVDHIKDAPPWRVFPNVKNAFPAVTQGENEFYMNYWTEWFNPLSAAEKDQYLREYGAPSEWFERFNSQGSWSCHEP